jgi:hypothetical protein
MRDRLIGRTLVFDTKNEGSNPSLWIKEDRSSIRLGRCPFTAERWVQIPYGS